MVITMMVVMMRITISINIENTDNDNTDDINASCRNNIQKSVFNKDSGDGCSSVIALVITVKTAAALVRVLELV